MTFVGECEFKTEMPNNVFVGSNYIGYIKSFQNLVFNDSEVNKIVNQLQNSSLQKGRATNKIHTSNLNHRQKVTSTLNINKDPKIICKRCGKVMVERRNRKTGEQFLGCSGYPKCKNTEQI